MASRSAVNSRNRQSGAPNALSTRCAIEVLPPPGLRSRRAGSTTISTCIHHSNPIILGRAVDRNRELLGPPNLPIPVDQLDELSGRSLWPVKYRHRGTEVVFAGCLC